MTITFIHRVCLFFQNSLSWYTLKISCIVSFHNSKNRCFLMPFLKVYNKYFGEVYHFFVILEPRCFLHFERIHSDNGQALAKISDFDKICPENFLPFDNFLNFSVNLYPFPIFTYVQVTFSEKGTNMTSQLHISKLEILSFFNKSIKSKYFIAFSV